MSAWVSTPPVIAGVSTMVTAISFLRLKGWHAPAGRRPGNPGLLSRTGRSGRHRRWVPENWGPADKSLARQPDAASADSEVRPGPRFPTLRPHRVKTGEAGPEALPTPSLPNRRSLTVYMADADTRADRAFMLVRASVQSGDSEQKPRNRSQSS